MLSYGSITAVYPPGAKQNFNKYQYEYSVLITGDAFTQIPLNHVLVMDEFGHFDSFNDRIFRIGQTVCVMSFRQNLSQSFIMGAMRVSKHITDPALGYHWKRRFNAVEQFIDKNGNWSINLDQGENIQLTKQVIKLDNSTGESITIDKVSQTITVNAGKDWTMQIGGNVNITASGDATVTCEGTATVEAPDIKLGVEATEAVIKGDTFAKIYNNHSHLGNLGAPVGPVLVPLPPAALSTKVKTE